MITNDYKKKESSFTYKTTLYRALTDDANGEWSIGDIIKRVVQIDAATLLPTGIESITNIDKDLALAVPFVGSIGTDIEALDSKRITLISEMLQVDQTVTGFTTIPTNANHAEVHVLDNDIIFTIDGASSPVGVGASLPIGFRQADTQMFELEGRDELINFSVVKLNTGDARLYIQYFQQYDFND